MLAEKYQVSKLQVMKHVGISPSVYYYQEKPGRKGCLPSKQTVHADRGEVDNKRVVDKIQDILSEPFQDYWGYHNITAELRDLGYLINHKKVYRLMKEEKLLKPSARLRPEKVARKFVKFKKSSYRKATTVRRNGYQMRMGARKRQAGVFAYASGCAYQKRIYSRSSLEYEERSDNQSLCRLS